MKDSDDESLPGGLKLKKDSRIGVVGVGRGGRGGGGGRVVSATGSSPSNVRRYRRQEQEQEQESSSDLRVRNEENGQEKLFFCSEGSCGRAFSSKFKMMRHMLIHSGERQFQCSLCDRCFHRKDHLKNHLQVHNPNKTIHTCGHCGKRYSSLLSYRKHLALHAAESGDLSCKLCGKNFEGKEQIMYHLKVHSGSRALKGPSERKFKCEQCDRCFFTRKDVKRHMVVHTGVRNFMCQFCPQRFGRKDHLVRHIKKSHAAQAASINNNNNNNNIPKDNPAPVKPVPGHHQHHHHHPHHHPHHLHQAPQAPVSSSNHDKQQILMRPMPSTQSQLLPPQSSSHSIESSQSSFSPFHQHHHSGSGMMSLQDTCPTYINLKQEPPPPAPPCFQGMQNSHHVDHPTSSSVITSSSMPCPEDADHLMKLNDVAQMIPVSQYFQTFPSSMQHLLPGNCYLTSVAGSSHLLPTLPPESVLQPLTSASIPFSTPMSLDVGNSSLPHFNQAFQ